MSQYNRGYKRQTAPGKYGNRRTIIEGITFDSAAESRRWTDLRLLERAGEISNLRRQVPYDCVVNGRRICKYKADFVYRDVASGELVVEDVKGHRTPEYTLKKKLVEALFEVKITEVEAKEV